MTQATTAPDAMDPADASAPGANPFASTLEAILFSADRPLSVGRLAEVLGLAPPEDEVAPVMETPPTPDAPAPDASSVEPKPRKKKAPSAGPSPAIVIRDTVAQLNGVYETTGRAFRIEQVAGGYRVMMLPEFAPAIAALQGSRARTSLSHAALETLAIISYKQPITRARLEAIRGVSCGEILRSLTERRLVTVAGRAEEVGRPILYGTSKRFLELFGLASLKDLPSVEELKPKT